MLLSGLHGEGPQAPQAHSELGFQVRSDLKKGFGAQSKSEKLLIKPPGFYWENSIRVWQRLIQGYQWINSKIWIKKFSPDPFPSVSLGF